jgi:hypothetical protein
VQALPVPDLDKAEGVIFSREFTRKNTAHLITGCAFFFAFSSDKPEPSDRT